MKLLLLVILVFFSFSKSYGQNWKELMQQVDSLYNIEEFEKAIPLSYKAISVARASYGINDSNYARSLDMLGELYLETGQYEKSDSVLKACLAIRKKILGEEHRDYAISLNKLATVYKRTGRYADAEKLFLQAMEIIKKARGEDHPDYAMCMNDLGVLYRNIGKPEMAEPLYLGAIAIYKKTIGEDNPNYIITLSNLGVLYRNMGQYEKAEVIFLSILERNKKTEEGNKISQAFILYDLGELYSLMGQYQKAEPMLLSASQIFRRNQAETDPYFPAILNSLGLLYQHLGQYTKAEKFLLEAKEIDKKVVGEDHPDYAQSLNNLAILYTTTGAYEKAEPIAKQVNEIYKKKFGEKHSSYGQGLNNLGRLYGKMDQFAKAEPLYIRALAIRKEALGENSPGYTVTLSSVANFYKAFGQYKKAEPLFIQTIALRKKILGEFHPDYSWNLMNLSELYTKTGQFNEAESLAIESSEIETKNLLNVFTILAEKEKADYVRKSIEIIDNGNRLLYANKNASPAFSISNFNLQVLIKSLVLNDTKNVLSLVRNSADISIQTLYSDWQKIKNILSRQYSLPVSKRRSDLKDMERQSELLEKELMRQSSTFRNQYASMQIQMKEVQAALEDDEVAIDFVSFDLDTDSQTDSIMYAAYVVNKKDPVPVFVPLFSENDLKEVVGLAGKSATAIAKRLYSGTESGKENMYWGIRLYKLIWQPLEPYLKNVKSISYSPAGKLYGIAFQALPVDSATLLMDKYRLQQYTSTRQVALQSQENQTIKPSTITLFGDADFSMDSLQLIKERSNQSNTDISTSIYTPSTRGSNNTSWPGLPGTAEEVKKIKQLFDQNKLSTQSYIQTAASEENLKALSGNSPQILHIATHGFFLHEADNKRKEKKFGSENAYTLADDPLLRSGLILSGGNYAWSGKTPIEGVEDGIATAYEISQLNLSNTELVVLSACETALGDVKGSEGVFGLQRAFKMAGVKKMIVSLWQVPDKETAELMTTFYSYWMKGKTIEESFIQAQADMRKKYSPFYWAAFVLVE